MKIISWISLDGQFVSDDQKITCLGIYLYDDNKLVINVTGTSIYDKSISIRNVWFYYTIPFEGTYMANSVKKISNYNETSMRIEYYIYLILNSSDHGMGFFFEIEYIPQYGYYLETYITSESYIDYYDSCKSMNGFSE